MKWVDSNNLTGNLIIINYPKYFFLQYFLYEKKKVYIGTYQIAYADSDISVIGHYRPTNILIGLSTKQRNDHKIYGVFFMTE